MYENSKVQNETLITKTQNGSVLKNILYTGLVGDYGLYFLKCYEISVVDNYNNDPCISMPECALLFLI